jgi:hypothetical protein
MYLMWAYTSQQAHWKALQELGKDYAENMEISVYKIKENLGYLSKSVNKKCDEISPDEHEGGKFVQVVGRKVGNLVRSAGFFLDFS